MIEFRQATSSPQSAEIASESRTELGDDGAFNNLLNDTAASPTLEELDFFNWSDPPAPLEDFSCVTSPSTSTGTLTAGELSLWDSSTEPILALLSSQKSDAILPKESKQDFRDIQPRFSRVQESYTASEAHSLWGIKDVADYAVYRDSFGYRDCFAQRSLSNVHSSTATDSINQEPVTAQWISSPLTVDPAPPPPYESSSPATVDASASLDNTQQGKRKRKPFELSVREKVKRVRNQRACLRCRFYKETVRQNILSLLLKSELYQV